ncbi:unnamed protein product [Staurois parvus]|uniref:Ig-like domain-containing protein n=1 Tax=Staurois parvus TaxID=386267 RepID=A0ABN9DTD0_9NEOB|nr:unnamed protein product [Staurois parvus]
MSPDLFVLLVVAAVGKSGSAARPVLKFRPNYSPIFNGEKIQMTCESQSKEDYDWFFNNVRISKGNNYQIESADSGKSGNYQCGTSDGSKSEMVTLNVTEDQLILQTAPYIHEGDRLMLKCHHKSGNTATRSKFFKNKAEIRGWDTDHLFLGARYNHQRIRYVQLYKRDISGFQDFSVHCVCYRKSQRTVHSPCNQCDPKSSKRKR